MANYDHASKIIGFRMGYVFAAPFTGALFGSTCQQAYSYFSNCTHRHNFNRKEKFKVYFVVIMSAIALVLVQIQLAQYFLDEKPNESTPNELSIETMLVPCMAGTVQIVVQAEFISQLKSLTKGLKLRFVVPILWGLSVVSFLTAWARTITLLLSVEAWQINGFRGQAFSLISILASLIWLILAFVVDVLLASLLMYRFKRVKENAFTFYPGDRLLTRLMVGVVTTFALPAFVASATLFSFLLPKFGASSAAPGGLGTFVFFQLLHLPIYSLSYVTTLARRNGLNERMRQDQFMVGLDRMEKSLEVSTTTTTMTKIEH